MPILNIANRAGDSREVQGSEGLSVMQVIRDSGDEEVLALCGGCCSCATCHVYVDEAQLALLPPMGSDEHELLEGSSHRRANSRLSCQIPFAAALDGLRVTIAPED